MRIVITEWALESYAHMVGRDFSEQEYWKILRPDILRLYARATDPRFKDAPFWGPAESRPNQSVPDGYKMKWRDIGRGRIQLRLCVAWVDGDAWLCHAFSKTSPWADYANGAALKDRIRRIREGEDVERGVLRERRG